MLPMNSSDLTVDFFYFWQLDHRNLTLSVIIILVIIYVFCEVDCCLLRLRLNVYFSLLWLLGKHNRSNELKHELYVAVCFPWIDFDKCRTVKSDNVVNVEDVMSLSRNNHIYCISLSLSLSLNVIVTLPCTTFTVMQKLFGSRETQ